MANVQHSSLTTTELHEPKGAAAASSNQTYVADGAGSGTWSEPEPKGVSAATANKVYVSDGAGSGAWTNKNDYAGLITTASDAATLSTIGTTTQTFPFASVTPVRGATATAATNSLQVNATGDYMVRFDASCSTVAAGDAGTYTWKLTISGTPGSIGCQREFTGSTDTGSVGFANIISLTNLDVLTISITSDNGGDTDDLNIVYANFNASLL